MEKYQYKPLPPGYSEIRLARLQPGVVGSNTPIEIEISHAELSSGPDYEALSYVWGSDEKTHSVKVLAPRKKSRIFSRRQKFLELRITSNLAVALRHLRLPTESRTVWIDAICINQEDPVERSTEVLEMGSIYRNARKVIVWLGPKSHNSDLALQTLKRLEPGIIHHPERRTIGYKDGSWVASLADSDENLISHAESWFAIKHLVNREWFSRLWVFQELALARSACILVGESSIDWGRAVPGLRWVDIAAARLEKLINSLEIWTVLVGTIRPFLAEGCEQRSKHILNVLRDTRIYHCRDPRDRLYAIRSLVFSGHRELITPDYTQSVEEVYTNFAKGFLSELRQAHFLALSDHPSNVVLPSWVPDWSSQPAVENDPIVIGRCSGTSTAFFNFHEDGSLRIQGILVTNLTAVDQPAQSLRTDHEIRRTCRSWKQFVSNGISIEDRSSFDHIFAETIVGGEVSELCPSTYQGLPSRAEIGTFLDSGPDAKNITSLIRRTMQGRTLFQTSDGRFGLGSQFARSGDCVAVILGCQSPLILRQEKLSGHTSFRIVGPCYFSGIMNGESLLGPLPAGWSARYELIQGKEKMVFSHGDIRTRQDPRMDLPPKWRYMYGLDEDSLQEMEAERIKDIKFQLFENTETVERTEWDPRLTPQHLRERGVAIEEIVLV